jgi:hypothetical protein
VDEGQPFSRHARNVRPESLTHCTTTSAAPDSDPAPRGVVSRRGWIIGTLLGISGMYRPASSATGEQGGTLTQSEQDEIAKVEAVARKARIGPFTHSQSEHFIGLGDAPAAFRRSALERAESFAKAFLSYFRAHGFKVELPEGRMIVITLKDADSYRALVGEAVGEAVGGHYDLETNRLVMFDLRNLQDRLAVPAERVNSLTLVHETAHLLCFNTGILSREANVPACISEGLATYVELWRPKDRSTLGGKNETRLKALRDEQHNPRTWIPLAELLKNNDRIDDPETEQTAYAESWLLIHYLFKKENTRTKFQAYLDGMKDQPEDPGGRIKYAESHLGPLDVLDRELRKHAREQSR